mmetsp:Transcript_10423/g.13664  ORF Transcript_10423/g.13664 Transcript_10423/m.13664 type:complete len:349 (-) Transcript_10423:324-1370(-)
MQHRKNVEEGEAPPVLTKDFVLATEHKEQIYHICQVLGRAWKADEAAKVTPSSSSLTASTLDSQWTKTCELYRDADALNSTRTHSTHYASPAVIAAVKLFLEQGVFDKRNLGLNLGGQLVNQGTQLSLGSNVVLHNAAEESQNIKPPDKLHDAYNVTCLKLFAIRALSTQLVYDQETEAPHATARQFDELLHKFLELLTSVPVATYVAMWENYWVYISRLITERTAPSLGEALDAASSQLPTMKVFLTTSNRPLTGTTGSGSSGTQSRPPSSPTKRNRGGGAKPSMARSSPQKRQNRANANDYCINYQNGKCKKTAADCIFAHRCEQCDALGHGGRQCPLNTQGQDGL